MNALFRTLRGRAGGQSLAETAIFLPVIIIMLLGVVEVSNLLVTQNRITAASRAATGFGATNFTGEEWKDEDAWSSAMVRVARNNVTDTLDLDEKRWDIWTIRASVNDMGDGFDKWTAVHAFGTGSVMTPAEWESDNVQGDVLTALRQSGDDLTKDLEIAATVAYHDRQSLLGLKAFNLGELTRIRGLNVMRVAPKPGTAGCALFPISVYHENVSLYPENYAGTMKAGGVEYDPGAWDYPANPGAYNDDPRDHSGFPRATAGTLFANAKPGDIFEARQTAYPATLGAFGWLSWDGDTAAGDLEASMTYPGNLSLDSSPPEGMVNYDNPHDPYDLVPNDGDWVQGSVGNMNSNALRTLLQDYIDDGDRIQIVVFDEVYEIPGSGGANYDYKISDFAIVRLIAYKNTTSDKRLLLEFISWGKECKGQLE
mgnify:CR=1 FL=1